MTINENPETVCLPTPLLVETPGNLQVQTSIFTAELSAMVHWPRLISERENKDFTILTDL